MILRLFADFMISSKLDGQRIAQRRFFERRKASIYMKKSTIALLAIVYGFIGFQAYALAPTFDNIPTVVISDEEDNSITVDNNWFRYINALNILDFTNWDVSLTPADLTYSFSEVTTHQEVAINDKLALDEGAGQLGTNPPLDKQLTTEGYWLSFQDLIRSPRGVSTPFPNPTGALPNGNLPWHAAGGTFDAEARGVVLWVVDTNDKSASTVVSVISIDDSFDKLSESVTTIFGGPLVVASTAADPSANNSWFLFSSVNPTPPAGVSYGTGSSGGGAMSIQTPAGTAGVKWFNRWQQTQATTATGKIPYVTGNVLYAAFFGLTHNAATRGQAPTLRIGVANGAENIQMYNAVNSVNAAIYTGAGLTDAQANTQLADAGVLRYYPVYWESFENTTNWDAAHMTVPALNIDARTWFAFFDVVDQDTNDAGTWTMSDFYVVTTPMPSFGAPEQEFTNFTAAGNWSVEGTNGTQITKTDNQPAAGMIRFTDTGSTTADYWYLWTNLVNKISWQKGKVIRLSFYLSCPTAANRANFHRFRGRMNAVVQNVTSELFVRRALDSSFGEPACPPVYSGNPADLLETMRYSGYTPSYGGPSAQLSAVPGGFDQFVLSFDALHNRSDSIATGNATAYSLHKAVIDIFDDPFGLD